MRTMQVRCKVFCPADSTMLTDWLCHNNIDTTAWGHDGVKSVENLWGEIQRGESVLLENPPRRVVRVVQVWIHRDDLLLLETAQTFVNGSIRVVNSLPAEKMHPGESPRQATLRCLHEELQIPPDEAMVVSAQIECRKKDMPSFSYPGLHSFYTLYRVTVALDGLPHEPFTTSELSHSEHDPVVLHHWAWIPIAAYRPR